MVPGGGVTRRPFLMRAILLSFFVASPALATCPTSDDLVKGVVLVQNEPLYVRSDVELRTTGFIEARITGVPGGEKSGEVRSFDHALALSQSQQDGTQTLYAYNPTVERLNRLDKDGEARFTVSERTGGGKEQIAQLLFTYEGQGETVIQSCTYDTWRVREMRADAGGTVTTRWLTYAPRLGLVLGVEAPDPADSFTYTWIGTAADVAR